MPKKPTVQQAYDRIRAYFSKPGARIAFSDEANTCRYRYTDSGGHIRKCAIGCLIPKKDYEPQYDFNMTTHQVLQALGWVDGPYPTSDDDLSVFLVLAQTRHDEQGASGSPQQFIADLDLLAADSGLIVRTQHA